jgi:hypothetical protein
MMIGVPTRKIVLGVAQGLALPILRPTEYTILYREIYYIYMYNIDNSVLERGKVAKVIKSSHVGPQEGCVVDLGSQGPSKIST